MPPAQREKYADTGQGVVGPLGYTKVHEKARFLSNWQFAIGLQVPDWAFAKTAICDTVVGHSLGSQKVSLDKDVAGPQKATWPTLMRNQLYLALTKVKTS